MKTILGIVGLVLLAGCSTHREIQVEMVTAELVKIDTVYRQPNEQKLLTWRDKDNIEYVSFIPMNQNFILGSTMTVLRTR